ncbi:hypothetical protein FH608_022405 [Nonomuraea phyllanthi]|uniref:Uncharacterized protein n=1 Tax=Nonomuraea phyllanthi TaxID=2219224 RepID=A0A5C4WC68_9ACTN|nr:hypothetical protein [Nonomuraea phyllanthi]KAB8193082.1 hypothetical protein FH608_022405 [Nonomuraea phyllanthi]QFY11056.1 hypothetical protein GBF35_34655 [Nonomuraea phyllanthi]
MHRKALTALTLGCALVAGPVVLAATPASAAARPSYRACYDGKCKFTFSKRVSFRVAGKYRLGRVYVSKQYVAGMFNQDMILVRSGGSSVYIGEGGSGSIGRLNFRTVAITSKGATIRFTG